MAEKTVIEGFLPNLSARPCCLLADSFFFNEIPVFGHIWPRIMIDQTGEGIRHRSGTGLAGFILRRERSGTVYTCSGGFIDISHLRDFADLTRQYFYALVIHRKGGVLKDGTQFPLLKTHGGIGGDVTIQRDISAQIPKDLDALIAIARSIAYAVSVMYEIKTYDSTLPGHRNSAFSPEDLVSNYLGTFVAREAIRSEIERRIEVGSGAGKRFILNAAYDLGVTVALTKLLDNLGVLDREKTIEAFEKIDGRWVKSSFPKPNFLDPSYVRRRNFQIRPIDPWLVPGVASCESTEFPKDVDRELPREARTAHLSRYFVNLSFTRRRNFFTNRDFNEVIELQIKKDAKERFGDDFDKP